jgi:hypothetical protein
MTWVDSAEREVERLHSAAECGDCLLDRRLAGAAASLMMPLAPSGV